MGISLYSMAVLYVGEWDETYDESKFNPNPVYRDTVNVNTDSFVVVQVAATNPGNFISPQFPSINAVI